MRRILWLAVGAAAVWWWTGGKVEDLKVDVPGAVSERFGSGYRGTDVDAHGLGDRPASE